MKEAHKISSLSCLNAFAEKNIATTARRHVETANQLLKPTASMYYHSILFISVQSFPVRFTFGQVLAEVHDSCHVAVDRGVRVGDGGLGFR